MITVPTLESRGQKNEKWAPPDEWKVSGELR